LEYLIIIVVMLIIALAIIKANKKDIHLEMNKLIQYLGGINNIINSEYSFSRLKVTLKDVSIVDKDAIQRLGAKGIVEIDNQLKIVLGPSSKKLKKYIDDLK
jgi:PTS system glucose-specific IIB component